MIKIYGSSDDLIEIDGDIRGAFYLQNSDENSYLGLSDGTLISVLYDSDGIWRFNVLRKGLSNIKKVDLDLEADEYSEVLEVDGKISWVLYGQDKAMI